MPIGIVISFGLIYIYDLGAMGLALKMIIAQFIGTTIQLYYNSKFLNFKMKYFLSHQFYSIIFFVILAYISGIIFSFDSNFWQFLASGIVYTLFVILFTYLFPQVFATTRDEIKLIANRIILKVER
jgi:hypothetical protein